VALGIVRYLALLLLLVGCAHDHRDRAAEAHAAFPQGTSRAEVDERWGEPLVTKTRPDIGWTDPDVLAIEERTGTLVYRFDQHVLNDTTSFWITLSQFACFYDRDDRVIDVVWERTGD
jgi:hypothetical protein